MMQLSAIGENYTHTVLWQMTKRMHRHARRAKHSAILDDAAAMVFAAMTFESYLNYLGEKIAPVVWRDERSWNFKKKIDYIFDLCGLPVPDKDVRPFKTVWQLKELRDSLAHGKIQIINEIHEHEEDELRPFLKGIFEGRVSAEIAAISLADIHEQCRILHEAGRPKVNDIWYGPDPLEGIHGYQTGGSI